MGTQRTRGAGRLRPVAVVLALAAAGPVRAAHPLVTDDAGTQGLGRRQVELTAGIARDHAGAGPGARHADGGEVVVAFAVGLHDRLDLSVCAPTTWSRVREGGATSGESGLGDVGAELKWRLLERGGLGLAVKAGATLPTGDASRGLGAGASGFGAALVVSQALGPVAVHLNAAWRRAGYGLEADRAASRADLLHGSVAVAATLPARLQLVADVGVDTNPARGADTHPAYALAGLVHGVTEAIDVDLGVKAGLAAPEPDLTLLAGLTTRF